MLSSSRTSFRISSAACSGVLPEENGISYYAVLKPFVDVETVTNVSVVTAFTDTTE